MVILSVMKVQLRPAEDQGGDSNINHSTRGAPVKAQAGYFTLRKKVLYSRNCLSGNIVWSALQQIFKIQLFLSSQMLFFFEISKNCLSIVFLSTFFSVPIAIFYTAAAVV